MSTTKKLLTGLSVKAFFLFGGIEYGKLRSLTAFLKYCGGSEKRSMRWFILLAVILPTLWYYLHEQFQADKFFYGLTLSAFSMANLLAGPLYGLAFDYTHRTKLIVLFGNLFEIGGEYVDLRKGDFS